jgi:hypothetical protein
MFSTRSVFWQILDFNTSIEYTTVAYLKYALFCKIYFSPSCFRHNPELNFYYVKWTSGTNKVIDWKLDFQRCECAVCVSVNLRRVMSWMSQPLSPENRPSLPTFKCFLGGTAKAEDNGQFNRQLASVKRYPTLARNYVIPNTRTTQTVE